MCIARARGAHVTVLEDNENLPFGEMIIGFGQDDANKALDLCVQPFGPKEDTYERYTRWACENAKPIVEAFAEGT